MKRLIAAIALAVFIVPAAFAHEQTVLARVTVLYTGEAKVNFALLGMARVCAMDIARSIRSEFPLAAK